MSIIGIVDLDRPMEFHRNQYESCQIKETISGKVSIILLQYIQFVESGSRDLLWIDSSLKMILS